MDPIHYNDETVEHISYIQCTHITFVSVFSFYCPSTSVNNLSPAGMQAGSNLANSIFCQLEAMPSLTFITLKGSNKNHGCQIVD